MRKDSTKYPPPAVFESFPPSPKAACRFCPCRVVALGPGCRTRGAMLLAGPTHPRLVRLRSYTVALSLCLPSASWCQSRRISSASALSQTRQSPGVPLPRLAECLRCQCCTRNPAPRLGLTRLLRPYRPQKPDDSLEVSKRSPGFGAGAEADAFCYAWGQPCLPPVIPHWLLCYRLRPHTSEQL